MLSINEVLNTLISAAKPSDKCNNAKVVRPCVKANGVVIPSTSYFMYIYLIKRYPPDYPCPCQADGKPGGAIDGSGKGSLTNPDEGSFNDEVIVDGFQNPLDVAFTDDKKWAFVCTKEVH